MREYVKKSGKFRRAARLSESLGPDKPLTGKLMRCLTKLLEDQ